MFTSREVRFSVAGMFFILAAACAKINAPTGGPRDRTPPVILETVPEPGAKNFRGKSVEITFNEFVTLDNITEKFMVSPPLKKKPRVFMKGKRVIAEFDEELRDSTTYTFYFQDAIKDLNEGNKIDNYQFVFSTGPVVDSLSVTGNVYNASNLEVPEKTIVMLYRELADSFVVKHLPDYITMVDQKGYFRINNVQTGTYRLYALTDADNSKNFNLPEEPFAFFTSPVDITPQKNWIPEVKDTVKLKTEPVKDRDVRTKRDDKLQDTIVPKGEYPLMLFEHLKKNHYLTSSGRPMKYQIIYTLSLPPDTLGFRFSVPEFNESSYFIEQSVGKDTIKVWLTDSTLYSKTQIPTIIDYPFTDSLGITGYRQDTIIMRFLPPRPTRGTKIKKASFTFESNIRNNLLKPGQQIVFTAATPFRPPDTSHVYLYETGDSSRTKIPYSLVRDSSNSCRYHFKTELDQAKKYLFVADSAAFGNIYNENADSTGINFSFRKPDSFSKLTLSIKNCKGNTVIQLLNNSEKLVSEALINTDGKVVFPLLESGIYRMKVIYDLNGDGKWTTGDFKSGIQPEPVSYYPAEIDIKTGWEVEQDWDIEQQSVKEQKLREKKTARR